MDILSLVKKTRTFKQLYSLPFKLDGTMPEDLEVAMYCNPCYGFGDIIFCIKMYEYFKEWYNIEPTLFTTRPKPFMDVGINKIYLLKKPGQQEGECADITEVKIYTNEKEPKRVKPKVRYDLMFATPWINGTDSAPNHKLMKKLFPYSNRFNTLLFSEYNPSHFKVYDIPTGIGKNMYGLLLKDWKNTGPRIVENPYLMVHMTQSPDVNVTACFSKFIKLMMKKYSKKHRKLDVIMPAHILDDTEGIENLVDDIIGNGYYDAVDIITKKGEYPKHSARQSVLRFRTELTPMPYNTFSSLFNYCLPDVLITGDQSVTDILSCCKDYNIYYQMMPWKRNFGKALSKVTKAKDNYLGKVRTSCGLETLSTDKLDIEAVRRDYDFRKLGREKLDGIMNNARLLTTNKDVKDFVKIVLHSRKRDKVIEKLELKK